MASSSFSLPKLRSLAPQTISYFLRPVQVLKGYKRSNLRPDLIAGLTVAIVLLPQAIAFAMIAELPPEMGLYAAIVTSIVGALWGASDHLQTGPTNTNSLLVLATLLPIATAGTRQFLAAAGVLAVMVGVIQIMLGVGRLGILVNFVSDSVIIGYTAGAGILIAANQMFHLFRIDSPSAADLLSAIRQLLLYRAETHLPSLLIGFAAMVLLALQKRFLPRWPGALLVMILSAAMVGLMGLDQKGIKIIGEIPRSLPPLADLPLLDFNLIVELATGALAVSAIGMVESIAISRSIAAQSGQRLDSNQQFVGLGLSNVFCGLFSGYSVSGSFTRSAINYHAGARSPMSGVFSGIFVLLAMVVLAPLAAYVPRAALAGVLMITAYGMVDKAEIKRIWRGTHGDAAIMVATLLSTLLLPLQFAVLSGILLSFAVYILRTSLPRVVSMLPAENFRHFTPQGTRAPCPQLAIIDILGDLYFGAVTRVEELLHAHLDAHPSQRFVLLRMFSVDQIDISGIHALESLNRALKERGGDLYMVRTQEHIFERLKSTGFYQLLGAEHFLQYDKAIAHLFYHVIDPTICIYECEARVFLECQNLPRPAQHPIEMHLPLALDEREIRYVEPHQLWTELHQPQPPPIIDVREPREFKRDHIREAQSIPLLDLLVDTSQIPQDQAVVLVCRSGRRSARAAAILTRQGYKQVRVLQGGMLAWETAGLLTAVDLN